MVPRQRNEGENEEGIEVSQGKWPAHRFDPYNGDPYSGYSLATQVALLAQTLDTFKGDVVDINNSIKELRADIKNINDMANKYRGGLLVVLTIGGVIGTIVAVWDKVVHAFH